MWIFKRKGQHHVGIETLSEYIDGRLSDAENVKVQEHLETCSSCAQELATMSYTVQLLHRVPMTAPRRVVNLEEKPIMVPVGWQNRVPVWAYGAAASAAIALFAVVLSADLGGLLTGETSTPDLPTQAVETAVESTIVPESAPGIEFPSGSETELQAPFEDAAEAVNEADTAASLLESTDLMPAEAAVPDSSDLEAVPEIKPLLPEEFPAEELPAEGLPVDRIPADAEPGVDDGLAVLPEPADTESGVDNATTSLSPTSQDALDTFEPKNEGTSTSVAWRVLEGMLAGIALLLVGWALWRARKAHSRVLS